MTQEFTSITDEELARETQAGSLAAFEQLVHRYEHRVYAFVFPFCCNPADAREITQDTFVKAFQAIGQFNSRRVFAAWLFTIARRKCIDRHRATPLVADTDIDEPSDDADPSQIATHREDGDDLWRLARQHLSTHQFQALWLHYAEDMNVAQIAEAIGKTKVHTKVILFRARQILGRELRPGFAIGEAVQIAHQARETTRSGKRNPGLLPAKLLREGKPI